RRARTEVRGGDDTRLPGARDPPAATLWRPCYDEGVRAAPFTACREPLHKSSDHEQERRNKTDRSIGRQNANHHGAGSHHENRKHQGHLTAACIAEATNEDSTERSRHETEPVGKKGRKQGRHIVAWREKILRDHAGDKRVNCEIVPLEHVADDGGGHRLATIGFIGLLHTCAPLMIASPLCRCCDGTRLSGPLCEKSCRTARRRECESG